MISLTCRHCKGKGLRSQALWFYDAPCGKRRDGRQGAKARARNRDRDGMRKVQKRIVCASALTLMAVLVLMLSGCFPSSNGGYPPNSGVMGVAVQPMQSNQEAAEAFRLVNEERSRRGMQTLRRRQDLDQVAYAHARDLIGMNKLNHTSSDGRQLEHRLARLDWEWAGENLARNKGFDSPAHEAVKGWIGSPKHFENMFRPDYSQSGMAALFDPASGFTYFVQIFIIPVR